MTTYNHVDIAVGAPANSAVFNVPYGTLDAAIGNLTLLPVTSRTSLVAGIGSGVTLLTADKTSLAAALNEVYGLAIGGGGGGPLGTVNDSWIINTGRGAGILDSSLVLGLNGGDATLTWNGAALVLDAPLSLLGLSGTAQNGLEAAGIDISLINGVPGDAAIGETFYIYSDGVNLPQSGFGVATQYFLNNDSDSPTAAGQVQMRWDSPTSGAENSFFLWLATSNGVPDTQVMSAGGGLTGPWWGVFNSGSIQVTHIPDPAGGGFVDAESRSAINAILVALEAFGFVAP